MMKFLDFRSISIFFEFVKNHHYTFYIIFFIGYVISCYIYFYHFFNRFDFDYIQYFSLLEILKLSSSDTLKVFGISISISFLIVLISLYLSYSFYAKKKFLDIKIKIDSFESNINTIDNKNEDTLKEIENVKEKIYKYNSQENCDADDLLKQAEKMKDDANSNKHSISKSKKSIIELRENLKMEFSLFNLLILIVNFFFYNYSYSETFIKKHEYPIVTINFTEENKTQDYKLLGNLETSILLSDEKLTKLEIIEKSNILSINIKNH